MRDFPVFTTESGVGSLILKEIPYTGVAYVTIHDSSQPEDFLEECVDFCRAVGAERMFATGHPVIENYPFYTSVLRMSASMEAIPDSDASLFPISEKTIARWCAIYNERMKDVDNAAYMSERAGKELLQQGNGYFIHKDGELLGIGIASDDQIHCLASVKRGSGKEILSALTHALMCDSVTLEVASTNFRAIRLYESLGFIKTAEISTWHKIF